MLGTRPWHPADLAQFLDCSEGEAEALLWGFGYAQDSTGLWRAGADDAASLIDVTVHEIDLAYQLGQDDFEETLKHRARHYLTTGELAPRPYLDEERYGDEKLLEREIEKEKRRESRLGQGADEEDDDLDGFEEDDEELPLEHLLMACACGKDDCAAVAKFGIANGRLKIGFTAATDHFVVDPVFLAQVAIQIAESVDSAKDPDDSE